MAAVTSCSDDLQRATTYDLGLRELSRCSRTSAKLDRCSPQVFPHARGFDGDLATMRSSSSSALRVACFGLIETPHCDQHNSQS